MWFDDRALWYKKLCFIMENLDLEISKGWIGSNFLFVLDICWKIILARIMKHVANYKIFP